MKLEQIEEMNKLYRNVGGGADWSVDAWSIYRAGEGHATAGLLILDNETDDSAIQIVYSTEDPEISTDAAWNELGSEANWIELTTVSSVQDLQCLKELNLFPVLAREGKRRLIERNSRFTLKQ